MFRTQIGLIPCRTKKNMPRNDGHQDIDSCLPLTDVRAIGSNTDTDASERLAIGRSIHRQDWIKQFRYGNVVRLSRLPMLGMTLNRRPFASGSGNNFLNGSEHQEHFYNLIFV